MKNNKKPVILVVDKVYWKGKSFYDSVDDIEIEIVPASEDHVSERIIQKNAYGVILDVEKYSKRLYDTLKKGSIIARFGVGFDGIDLAQASNKGIYVTNTPGVLETTVAEFTVLLAGEVLRKPGLSNRNMKTGLWNPFMGNEFRGKIWAILGFGKVGKELSKILSFGFGVRVIAYDINISDPRILNEQYGIERISSDFSKIIPSADIISLHMPANSDTYHFLNKKRLQQFKRGSILINTGRGILIDENSLYDELFSGHIAGAGLDVFENEPYKPIDQNKDLRNLPNVVLTPHIASSTVECSARIAEKTIQNIRFSLEKKYELMDIVN